MELNSIVKEFALTYASRYAKKYIETYGKWDMTAAGTLRGHIVKRFGQKYADDLDRWKLIDCRG